MGDSSLTKDQVVSNFQKGINCCQCVIGVHAETFDFDPVRFETIGAAFGGGMMRGDTCGAVVGALMILGLAYAKDPQVLRQKVSQFQESFSSACGSTICRELLPYDLSKPGQLELARSSGIMTRACPVYVETSLSILDDLLQDYYETL